MAERVGVWSVFAYRDDDGECGTDERRSVTGPNIAATVEEFAKAGFDNIYLHLSDTFECGAVTERPGVTHFWHG